MATPVPVVSMMYFLLSRPPKISDIVSPAFSAMSTKLAMGCVAGDVGFAACCANEEFATNSTTRMKAVMGTECTGGRIPGTKDMLTSDTRLRLHASQGVDPLLNGSMRV